MSSHHFVKEGQEPALLVVDAIADDHLMSLLEWSPLVMVVQSALSKVASWGITVDVVLKDADAHSELVTEIGHVGEALVLEADRNFPGVVFSHLRSLGQNAVNVMVSSPEKHFDLWDVPGIQVNLIDFDVKWSHIASGRFEKWLPEGSVVYLSTDAALEISGGNPDGQRVIAGGDGFVRMASPSPFWVGERHRDEV